MTPRTTQIRHGGGGARRFSLTGVSMADASIRSWQRGQDARWRARSAGAFAGGADASASKPAGVRWPCRSARTGGMTPYRPETKDDCQRLYSLP
jgi:hypothetical protein